MTGSYGYQLDLNAAGVRGLVGFPWPGTHRLPKDAWARAGAALRKHSRSADELDVVLPHLLSLRTAERLAHDFVRIPKRLGRQLDLVKAHALWRYAQLISSLHSQPRQHGAGEHEGHNLLQCRFRSLTGQRWSITHVELQLPVVQLLLP